MCPYAYGRYTGTMYSIWYDRLVYGRCSCCYCLNTCKHANCGVNRQGAFVFPSSPSWKPHYHHTRCHNLDDPSCDCDCDNNNMTSVDTTTNKSLPSPPALSCLWDLYNGCNHWSNNALSNEKLTMAITTFVSVAKDVQLVSCLSGCLKAIGPPVHASLRHLRQTMIQDHLLRPLLKHMVSRILRPMHHHHHCPLQSL